LGKNIQKQLGNVQLGRSVRIFIRDQQDRVVGGIVSDLFGGWAYISLLWIDESLRNRGLGTRLVTMLEQEVLRLATRMPTSTPTASSPALLRKTGLRAVRYPGGLSARTLQVLSQKALSEGQR